ncbi:unnamed protein product [Boreogadus saida]
MVLTVVVFSLMVFGLVLLTVMFLIKVFFNLVVFSPVVWSEVVLIMMFLTLLISAHMDMAASDVALVSSSPSSPGPASPSLPLILPHCIILCDILVHSLLIPPAPCLLFSARTSFNNFNLAARWTLGRGDLAGERRNLTPGWTDQRREGYRAQQNIVPRRSILTSEHPGSSASEVFNVEREGGTLDSTQRFSAEMQEEKGLLIEGYL